MKLEDLIAKRHPVDRGEWAVFHELTEGQAGRRIDVAAFNCWPSNHFYRVAYEVKRSKADFRRELAKPDKRRWAEEMFHETYFVAEAGVCTAEEVPDGWGLLVPSKSGQKLRRLKIARVREPKPLGPWLIASILSRAYTETHGKLGDLFCFEGAELSRADLQLIIDERVAKATERRASVLDSERKRVLEERDCLYRARATLEAPLEKLMMLAGRRYEPLTPEHVEAWAEKVRMDALKPLRRQLEGTHAQLGAVLASMEEAS